MRNEILSGLILDDEVLLSLGELSHACTVHAEWVVELVEEGILEPTGRDLAHWRFPATSLQRAHTALRLQQDLDINLAGVSVILDLIDEMEGLRARLNISGSNK